MVGKGVWHQIRAGLVDSAIYGGTLLCPLSFVLPYFVLCVLCSELCKLGGISSNSQVIY